MKKHNFTIWIYVATPVILLVIFTLAFKNYQAVEKSKADAQAIVDKQNAEAKTREQAEMESKMDEQAKKFAIAKAQAEAEKAAKDTAERRKKIESVRGQIESINGDIANKEKMIDAKTADVKAAREVRLQTESDWMTLAKNMEKERAEKSEIEMEALRMTGVVQDRFNEDWCKALVTPPPPPLKQ
jgi:hypothetical protein